MSNMKPSLEKRLRHVDVKYHSYKEKKFNFFSNFQRIKKPEEERKQKVKQNRSKSPNLSKAQMKELYSPSRIKSPKV